MDLFFKEIINSLDIKESVIAIIPYGSRVYGTFNDDSDHDFVIITKNYLLNSGSFKDNSISSKDFKIQGTLYSRSGFSSALNNYDITAWECISLPIDGFVYCAPFFSKHILDVKRRFDVNEMVKSIITQSSSSRYISKKHFDSGLINKSKRGMFHSLRVLFFGLQIKEYGKILDFSICNDLFDEIDSIPLSTFNISDYDTTFNELCNELKTI